MEHPTADSGPDAGDEQTTPSSDAETTTPQAPDEQQAPPGAEPAPAAPDAAVEEEAPQVSVQVEETGPCERLLKLEIPAEMVHDEIEKSYEELRKTLFIKGFRKGHVPRHVLVRRFGDDVLDGVKHGLIDENFSKAVESHSLRLAVPASIDYDAITLEADKPLAFEAKVEVVPDFTIDNYKGFEVERPAIEVTPEDVNRALEGYRLRQGQYRVIEEGVVEETDVPVCHAIAIHEGQEIWRQTELGANPKAGTLGGMPVPGLKEAILGARMGDSRSFKLVLPDSFAVEEHRGKEADLEVTVDEIRRFEAPEATDKWAESLGFDDLDDLREELYDELRRQREQEGDDAVQDRISDKLLQLTDFEVPPGLVDRMVASTVERQRMELLYRGARPEQIDEALAAAGKNARETTVRHAKLYFILEKIADQEKIFVTEDEVSQRIQAIALNYRRRPEEVRGELERANRLGALRQQMREEKVRDFLVQNATVTQAGPPPAAADAAPPDTGAPAAEPQAEPPTEGPES